MRRGSGGPVPPYSLREVTAGDFAFLRELHRTTMRETVEAMWGWDEADQEARFREKFAPGTGRIIVVDGRDVGFLHTVHGEDEVFLAEIQLSPPLQGRGLGTRLIRDLLEKADEAGHPVVLSVLKTNPARRLYDRLGFRVVAEDGERFFMERTAPDDEP